MFEPNSTLHRCRNLRCRTWLKQPAENPRNAFCCAGCEVGYFRTHCRVCDRPIEVKNSRRQLCGRSKCETQFRRHRDQFFSTRYGYVCLTAKPEKSSTKSTSKTTIKSNQGFAIGHDYDREVLRENFRINARFWNAVATIGPRDLPVVRGGYKSGGHYKLLTVDQSPDSNPCLGQITDDLSIPAFLKRGRA